MFGQYVQLLAEANNVDGSANSLDGKTKQQAMKIVNKIFAPLTKGIHTDQYWKGVSAIWDAMSKANVSYTQTGSEYKKDKDSNVNTSKIWNFEVTFNDAKGKEQIIHGRVVASGAGSVKDPLDKYDVVAYVN